MKKLLLASVAVASLAGTSAFAADVTDLSGFSIGTNVEFSRGAVNATDGSSDGGATTGAGLQARYDWALTPTFALGLGASYSSGNHLHGNYTNGSQAGVNNRYSIDLIPTVALSNGYQLFGKVSSIYGTASSSDGVNTTDAQGVGYGIGVRKMLDKNLFVQAGYDLNKFRDVTYSNGTTASLQENVYSIGIGYKFR
ncbi:MAG: outer membrane beta-barrel protein [Rhodoferax sp.]|uniref:outer membrane beta-barrel protein n=1 Tax=Rhodoferax sp. TaxID=50421 RepID=UPI002ACDEEFE|nr:outer membrane beta-barrel protein [Rhodoferax sp.]MDZ7891803.1 outer membrane beta-barrel protein [Rhodoferax sp.]